MRLCLVPLFRDPVRLGKWQKRSRPRLIDASRLNSHVYRVSVRMTATEIGYLWRAKPSEVESWCILVEELICPCLELGIQRN